MMKLYINLLIVNEFKNGKDFMNFLIVHEEYQRLVKNSNKLEKEIYDRFGVKYFNESIKLGILSTLIYKRLNFSVDDLISKLYRLHTSCDSFNITTHYRCYTCNKQVYCECNQCNNVEYYILCFYYYCMKCHDSCHRDYDKNDTYHGWSLIEMEKYYLCDKYCM